MKIIDIKPQPLLEKQIIFNKGAPYGQIVFMMGGAGSGKGFVISNFMQGEKFKIRDVDEIKGLVLKLNKIKNKYPEISDLDFKNPADVFKLHLFVEEKGIVDKTLDNLLADLKKDRLPNVIFDRTGKTIQNILKRIPPLLEIGYKPKDIHLVWVLTDYKVAIQRNKSRDRIVPDDILLQTHKGAAATMNKVIQGKTNLIGKQYIDGEVKVVLNNKENTIFYTDEEGNAIKTSSGNPVIKSFSYVTVKKTGKKPIGTKGLKDTLYKWILANVPPTKIDKDLGMIGK